MENQELAKLSTEVQIVKPSNQDLQLELFNHKQHIAAEVKNVLFNELSTIVVNSFQILNQDIVHKLANLEKDLKLEVQQMGFKLDDFENRIKEIYQRTEKMENLVQTEVKGIWNGITGIREENLALGVKVESLTEDLVKGLRDLEKWKIWVRDLEKKVYEGKEDQGIKVALDEIRNFVEYQKYEFQSQLVIESQKNDEKLLNLKLNLEKSIKSIPPPGKSQSKPYESLANKQDLIEYINDNISKWYLELNPLKTRLEKLEKTEYTILEFIKNYKN